MSLQRFLERLIWLCMLPLIVLGAVVLLLHLHTLNERRQMLVDSVVRAAAASLDQMLEVRLSSLELLSRVLAEPHQLLDGRMNLARAHEASMEYVNLHHHHVVVGSATGEMLINTRLPFGQALPPLPQEHHHTAVMMALTGHSTAVGDPFVGPIAHAPLVALAVALPLPRQPPLVLITGVETAQLGQRMRSQFDLPEGWVLRLQTSTGQEVFRIPDIAPGAGGDRSREGPWRGAPLSRAPWTLALMAPPVSPLDHAGVRALLLTSALAATVAIAYGGAHAAATRLTRAMEALSCEEVGASNAPEILEVARVKAELMRLDRERLAAQEDERRRIGLELHDDLQQKLALVRHNLASQPADAHRDRTLNWVDESIASTRRLVQDLRPPMLKDLGLPLALQALGEQHQESHGQAVDVLAPDTDHWCDLPEDRALALYRIAQEALNNVRKHSKADTVHITLLGSPGRQVVMEVADDGDGFHFNARTRLPGHGLRGMKERAQALGGHLEVTTAPGDGTALVVRLPWPLAPEPQG